MSDTEAMELEDMAPMPEDLVELRLEKLRIDTQIEELKARKNEIQRIFKARMEELGVKKLVLFDKPKVSMSSYFRDNIPAKAVAAAHPRLFKRFNRPVKVERVDIR